MMHGQKNIKLQNVCSISSITFVWTFLILREIQRNIIKNVTVNRRKAFKNYRKQQFKINLTHQSDKSVHKI